MTTAPLSVHSGHLQTDKGLTSNDISSPRRHVARSQSRQLEDARDGLKDVPSLRDLDSDWERAHRARKKKNSSNGEELTVVEESLVRSPHGCRSESEFPEDPANISGTTILPTDSEPDTGDLDPVMMSEALPDLQRAAEGILNFILPRCADPIGLLSLAKGLRNPKNTQSRRFQRFVKNLKTEAQVFGHHEFIDGDMVKRLLPYASLDQSAGDKEWNPDPILHKANCALLVVNAIYADPGSLILRQLVKRLEGQFPAPFMKGIVASIEEGESIGKSVLERPTLDLALDIRTQFLRLELESRRHEENFDPEAILKQVFFDESVYGDFDHDSGQVPLRGFGIAPFQDENGHLPRQFEEHVYERVQDIGVLLRNEDGSLNLRGLEAAYHWQGFVHRAIRWVRKRNEEISRELKSQPSSDDVRDTIKRELSHRTSLERTTQDGQVRNMSTDHGMAKHNGDQHEKLNQAEKVTERRKSKGAFRNTFAIERITERLRAATETSEPPRHSDPACSGAQSAVHDSDRHQTTPISAQETREIPVPADDHPSPRLSAELQDEFGLVDDSHLDVGDTMEREAERSHSPPILGRATCKQLQEPVSRETAPAHLARVDPKGSLPSTQELWRAVTGQATPGPSREQATEARRRAFIDRQENAYRVSPISQGVGSAERQRTNLQNPRKRSRAIFNYDDDDDDDDDDDNGFSVDDRNVDVVTKRSQKPDQSQHKRQRLDDNHTEGQFESQLQHSLERSTVPTQEPVNSRHQLPWQRVPAPRAPTPETGWLSSRPQARTQKRWSEAENQRLVLLIEKFGVQWARIKRQDDLCPASDGGPKLSDRSQVQLKDRARNLVLSYLRNGEPLPKNFDQVTIKAVDRKRLERQGIKIPSRIE
ncbi:hypothetical protein MAP00_008304 [Monascus purpureus]|nr:hypothetical protein MAP00_008304 [Monascus purpureus]